MTAVHTLGIDPGQDGAAVLLDPSGRVAAAVWSWRKRQRERRAVYVVKVVHRGETQPELTLPSLYAIGLLMAEFVATAGAYRLVVEGLFIPRKAAGAGMSAITIGKSVGYLAGPLVDGAVTMDEPQACVWRPDVLGLPPNASSDAAEAAAIRAVTLARPPLVSGMGELATDPHAAEAACQARWGHVRHMPRSSAPCR